MITKVKRLIEDWTVRVGGKMKDYDYNKVYAVARVFVAGFSDSIIVQDTTQETVLQEGIEYPCVPLKFPAKGNVELYEKLLQSGNCTKMDGCVEGGIRYRRVLLWIESDCNGIHKVIEK